MPLSGRYRSILSVPHLYYVIFTTISPVSSPRLFLQKLCVTSVSSFEFNLKKAVGVDSLKTKSASSTFCWESLHVSVAFRMNSKLLTCGQHSLTSTFTSRSSFCLLHPCSPQYSHPKQTVGSLKPHTLLPGFAHLVPSAGNILPPFPGQRPSSFLLAITSLWNTPWLPKGWVRFLFMCCYGIL